MRIGAGWSRQELQFGTCGVSSRSNKTYSQHSSVVIGKNDKTCENCDVKKFKGKTPDEYQSKIASILNAATRVLHLYD